MERVDYMERAKKIFDIFDKVPLTRDKQINLIYEFMNKAFREGVSVGADVEAKKNSRLKDSLEAIKHKKVCDIIEYWNDNISKYNNRKK